MKPVRIAQIGTSKNSHGNHIWSSINRQADCFDVVGYAIEENEEEKFPKQVEEFGRGRRMSVEEILSDPTIEAVAVETEEIYLTRYATMVAKAGKHLHMEKPGGTDLKDFEALVELLKANKLVFSLGYMYRFNPAIQQALARVKSGELGKIYSVEAHMDCTHPAETRQWLQAFPGGMMFFLGCHLIDLIYQIQGIPKEVIPLNCTTGLGGVTGEDYGMAVLRYENGLSFAKTCAAERGGFFRRQLVICGEKGTLELKPLEVLTPMGQYTVTNEALEEHWHKRAKSSRSPLHNRYDAMMRNFAQLVRGKENPYSYDYELELYRLLHRCCQKESTT